VVPPRGPGAKPVVSWGREAKPPEAESFEAICTPKEGPKICCQYMTKPSK